MIRSRVLTLAIATMTCLLLANSATAECTSCNSGCATGNCATPCSHGCGGHCGIGGQTGACVTCAGIWDDYCATKKHCLPHAKYPLQNYHGHIGCAGCCGVGVGVGIYGVQSCSGGHCGLGLFKHKKAASCETGCDVVVESGCDATGCSECASVDAHSQSVTARHGYMIEQPSAKKTGTMPTSLRYAPDTLNRAAPEEMIVPRAPRLPEDTRSGSSGFHWLQRALKIQ